MLAARPDVDFAFISYERSDGIAGRDNLDDKYDFVIPAYSGGKQFAAALNHARDDDVVIIAPMEGSKPFCRARDGAGGLTFLYTERLLKRGQWWRYFPPKIYRVYRQFLSYKTIEPWILCSSAFTSADLSKFGFPPQKCLKWGYFPQTDACVTAPQNGVTTSSVRLCSAQRLLRWKHVELQLRLLQRLKSHGFIPSLHIVGDGPEMGRLKALTRELRVGGQVDFLGRLSHGETLSLMASCDIFLATSDRHEGWGATVNEAMNMGCVVVGSSLMGSVPYLVRDGQDGLTFKSRDLDGLARAVIRIMENPFLMPLLSASAINRVSTLWGASCAASRLVETCETLLSGGQIPRYEDGPLSLAPVLEDDWFRPDCGHQ